MPGTMQITACRPGRSSGSDNGGTPGPSRRGCEDSDNNLPWLSQPRQTPARSRTGPGGSEAGRDAARGRWRRGLGIALIGGGLVMLPWLVVLATGLPSHYQAAHWAVAWVGLDGLEAAGLLATGWLVLRADPWRCLPATATAVLLTVDAWFDVATAAPGQDQAVAIAMAICPELPLAALCATLAVRSLPRRR
jgi:hypothetical protein